MTTLVGGLPVWAAPESFSGVVVDAVGKPVQGAQVWLYRIDRRTGQDDPLVEVAPTGPDGSFSLHDADYARLRARERRWAAYAYAPGYALDSVETPYASEPLELVLRPPATISGTVVGTGHRPIAGASVSLRGARGPRTPGADWRSGFASTPEEVAEHIGTRTDGDGAFRLRVLPRGWVPLLVVRAEGYGAVRLSEHADVALLRLGPLRAADGAAGRIQGRILGHEVPHGLTAPRVAYYCSTARATAGASGQYVGSSLNEGKCKGRRRTATLAARAVLAGGLEAGRRANASEVSPGYDLSAAPLLLSDRGCDYHKSAALLWVAGPPLPAVWQHQRVAGA